MSNFEFVPTDWAEIRTDAIRAESYAAADPRSCVFYSRRVLEHVVTRIYDLERLPVPYRSDLAAKLGDAGFIAAVGTDIVAKATIIRRLGNVAVHETRTVTPEAALTALRQLHDLLKWAVWTYSAEPDSVPNAAAYDLALIPSATATSGQPALSASELNQLLATFEAKDAALAEAKATQTSLQTQLDQARAAVKAAQAAKQPAALTADVDEAETRLQFIDLDLAEAGWALTDARDREYPVMGMPNNQGQGYIDYVLWGDDGLPLAVVEAKRTMRDALVGQQQAKLYADCLAEMTGRRPIIFCTNGYERWIWDDAAGYPPRRIAGFLTKDELELMVQRRRTRLPLRDSTIDKTIVERHSRRGPSGPWGSPSRPSGVRPCSSWRPVRARPARSSLSSTS